MLFRSLQAKAPGLVVELEAFFTQLRSARSGEVVEVPLAWFGYFRNPADFRRCFEGRPEEEQELAERLLLMSGRDVVVYQDNREGPTLVGFADWIPDDLAPMVILDASGRVRSTYDLWGRSRGRLHRLPSATKSYERLIFNVWRRSGGKSAFIGAAVAELVEGLAKTVSLRPDEEWLIISHKQTGEDLRERLARQLPLPEVKVQFLTWGRHTSTNEYRHIRNVILAGTQFYRPADYMALAMASTGQVIADPEVMEPLIDELAPAESLHHILQGVCRSAIRLGGEHGPACNVYVIASERSGIRRRLAQVFPDCHVVEWEPIPPTLTGKVGEAYDFILRWFEDNDGPLKFSVVQKAVGIKGAGNFKNDIRDHAKLKAALEEEGIAEVSTSGKYRTAYARCDDAG